MSKLDRVLGVDKNFEKKIKQNVSKEFGESYSKSDIVNIPVVDLCLRYSNKFINDPKTAVALKASIEKNGLLQPILVMNIEEYLAKENPEKEEKKYLLKMKDEYGSKYFISSGHRRYKAVLSLAADMEVENEDDVLNAINHIRENNMYEEYQELSLKNENDKRNRWLFIACKIGDKKSDKEEAIYSDTNLTSRNVTSFERITNAMDNVGKKDYVWSDIQEYINEKYGILENQKTIQNTLALVRSLSKEKRFLKAVYDGKLTQRDAIVLSSKMDLIEDKEKVLNDIYDGALNISEIKKLGEIKRSKGRPKKVTFSQSEILDYLNQIKRGTKTVDEVIKIIKNS